MTDNKKSEPSYTVENDIDGWSFRTEAAYHPGKCQERARGIMETEARAEAMAEAAGNIIADRPLSEPVVRVGVAIWIHNKDGHVLMGRRKGSHGAGTWSLPGGHVDFGEHPHTTVRRELMEECGMEVGGITRSPVPYGHRIFPQDIKQYITLFFDAEYLPGGEPPRNMEPDKCEGWHWFALDSLPSPLFGALDDEAMIQNMREANA
jgi:8-oxo-dGTP diphosphatase